MHYSCTDVATVGVKGLIDYPLFAFKFEGRDNLTAGHMLFWPCLCPRTGQRIA